jgi:hypothetical protein
VGSKAQSGVAGLGKETDLLRTESKSKSARAIHEIDSERIAAVRRQDRDTAQVREWEARLASLKLFRAELEARERTQKSEREAIERSLRQHTEKKHAWDDGDSDNESVSQRLSDIARLMCNELAQEEKENEKESPCAYVQEGIRLLNAEAGGMRMQIAEVEAMLRLVPLPRRTPVPVVAASEPKPRQKSALISEAQAKVNQIRRSRERKRR